MYKLGSSELLLLKSIIYYSLYAREYVVLFTKVWFICTINISIAKLPIKKTDFSTLGPCIMLPWTAQTSRYNAADQKILKVLAQHWTGLALIKKTCAALKSWINADKITFTALKPWINTDKITCIALICTMLHLWWPKRRSVVWAYMLNLSKHNKK